MKLNCDLGEGFGAWQMGNDAEIMPYIDQANIACGLHAGDPLIMQKTIALAVANNVSIGAHPSYPDRQGFGRRSMALAENELIAFIHYQLAALQGMCQLQGATLDYVKPHGALYNDMMRDMSVFENLCKAISQFDADKALFIQAMPDVASYREISSHFGITLKFEAFADRNYQSNGLLVPRTQANAVISDIQVVAQRVQKLRETGQLVSVDGNAISLQVDTLCVHGDTDNAIALVKAIAKH